METKEVTWSHPSFFALHEQSLSIHPQYQLLLKEGMLVYERGAFAR